MWKVALFGTAMLAAIGGTLANAQDGSRRGYGTGHWGGAKQHELTADDMAAFTDARIAALKAGLRLTSTQEPNWPAFEQALRDIAKARSERMAARRNAPPQSDDPIERVRRRADRVSQTGALLKQLADTMQPLYQSLDEAQKRRFLILARHLRPHMRHTGSGTTGAGRREGANGVGREDGQR